jgi:hypothetical protein
MNKLETRIEEIIKENCEGHDEGLDACLVHADEIAQVLAAEVMMVITNSAQKLQEDKSAQDGTTAQDLFEILHAIIDSCAPVGDEVRQKWFKGIITGDELLDAISEKIEDIKKEHYDKGYRDAASALEL